MHVLAVSDPCVHILTWGQKTSCDRIPISRDVAIRSLLVSFFFFVHFFYSSSSLSSSSFFLKKKKKLRVRFTDCMWAAQSPRKRGGGGMK